MRGTCKLVIAVVLLAMVPPALSQSMRELFRERMMERRAMQGSGTQGRDSLEDESSFGGTFTPPAGVTVERDVAYGSDPAQRLDVYRATGAHGDAPLLFMVHGGGWRRGDKAAMGVVKNKVLHWVTHGWVMVSVNYRVVPAANPLVQADDVARALAYAQAHAKAWGADPAHVVVMGHSAGAHLVSLLTSDASIGERAGVKPWLATVAIESAAFDVEAIMNRRHFGLYDEAFGSDPDLWRQASPTLRLSGKPVAPLLAICSSRRQIACPQAHAYADKAKSFGGNVSVLAVDMTHGEANARVGEPGSYTSDIDAFLRAAGAP